MNCVMLRPSFVRHSWVAGSGSPEGNNRGQRQFLHKVYHVPSPTPPSPLENIKETPRAPKNYYYKDRTGISLFQPSCANPLHDLMAKLSGTIEIPVNI